MGNEKLMHPGTEITVREILKIMYPMGMLRPVVKKVRKDCTMCRKMLKKTVDLQLAKHNFTRTCIAPVFYNVMIDIAYGFTGKPHQDSRKSIKVYALVVVCMLTSATNILALEGIETQEILRALSRHSSRYGVPAEIFVDAGAQMIALENAEFSVRDLDMRIQRPKGVKVNVATPKAHHEQGRVEVKIRILRDLLERSGKTNTVMTPLDWETEFALMASMMDDVPMAKGRPTNAREFTHEILSPNRL